MEIITNAENRKELVKALSGHFGQRSEVRIPWTAILCIPHRKHHGGQGRKGHT